MTNENDSIKDNWNAFLLQKWNFLSLMIGYCVKNSKNYPKEIIKDFQESKFLLNTAKLPEINDPQSYLIKADEIINRMEYLLRPLVPVDKASEFEDEAVSLTSELEKILEPKFIPVQLTGNKSVRIRLPRKPGPGFIQRMQNDAGVEIQLDESEEGVIWIIGAEENVDVAMSLVSQLMINNELD